MGSQKRIARSSGSAADTELEAPKPQTTAKHALLDDTVLDEIDAVLEEVDAQEFVNAFVQRGGQ